MYRSIPPPPSAPSSKPRKPAALNPLEHDRAGAVAEQHARRAVVPVHHLRQEVAADDERAVREPAGEHRVRLGDGVDEARTPGRQIVGGRRRRARARRRSALPSRERPCPASPSPRSRGRCRRRSALPAREPPAQRGARCRTTPRPARRHAARGCPSVPRSTRRRCRRSSRARRSSAPAPGRTRRGP